MSLSRWRGLPAAEKQPHLILPAASTSLIRGASGLMEMRLPDIPLSGLARKRRSRLGFVFQSFNLIPVLTALENVEYPLMIGGMPEPERRIWAENWLARMGLLCHARKKPDQLSGGQRQRVAIARAMVSAPALVIADEPTANLDSATTRSILDLMQEFNTDTTRRS